MAVQEFKQGRGATKERIGDEALGPGEEYLGKGDGARRAGDAARTVAVRSGEAALPRELELGTATRTRGSLPRDCCCASRQGSGTVSGAARGLRVGLPGSSLQEPGVSLAASSAIILAKA